MSMKSFEKIINNSKVILTEGALAERLKKEYNLEMDNSINHAGLIYSNPSVLETIYRQYINIGKKYDLPIMIMTPTRRVNIESINKSNFSGRQVIADSCHFLNRIKNSYGKYSEKVLVGGLLGCKGDAYNGEKVMTINESYEFHQYQTIQFEKQNIDYFFAGIMPEINEAIGIAKAMAETRTPYIISFMIKKNGSLLDGTAISDAIKMIDKQVKPIPAFYMTNCIHPTNLIEALNNIKNRKSSQLKRFRGIQANASILSCEELDNCNILQQDDFHNIIEEMYFLQKYFDLKIFGGCCGTNDEFIENLAKELTSIVQNNV